MRHKARPPAEPLPVVIRTLEDLIEVAGMRGNVAIVEAALQVLASRQGRPASD